MTKSSNPAASSSTSAFNLSGAPTPANQMALANQNLDLVEVKSITVSPLAVLPPPGDSSQIGRGRQASPLHHCPPSPAQKMLRPCSSTPTKRQSVGALALRNPLSKQLFDEKDDQAPPTPPKSILKTPIGPGIGKG